MYPNSLHQDAPTVAEPRPQTRVAVATIGFGAAWEEKLKPLFQQQPRHKNLYVLVPPTEPVLHVLLVNYDNPLALRKKDLILSKKVGVEVIAISQGPIDPPPAHHLSGLLTTARLITALDRLSPLAGLSERVLPQTMAAPPLPQIPPISPAPAVATGGYRVLVVDDSLPVQKDLEHKLSTLEQITSIAFAQDGATALAMAQQHHYDLIFLDVIMPDIDGYEVCTQLRRNPQYKKTPIIMVSGKTSPLDEVKGVMAGCTTYLTKPVQEEAFKKLSARIVAWLTARRQEQRQPVTH
jgi:CheY-like chemotaxis protein